MGESFQALATAQGEEFVRECALALTRAGFEVIGERVDLVDTGCEVDLLARGMRVLAEHRLGAHQHARCAKAALQRRVVDKRLL